ncbi:MAG: hypothetical protein M1826_006060 [Phylliscum demangeonii]|nr:MAG: hypothetical protein M1826_006060 [Phylliscum demangeonii]
MLENECDDLHDQLAQEDARGVELEGRLVDAQARRDQAHGYVAQMEEEQRTKNREAEVMSAELAALQLSSVRSAKLLTEKLALAHEVASLKPEVEHLRSHAASYQSTLSEKLQLQKEFITLQVELETEKRALQKATAKNVELAEQDAEGKAQLTQLRKELAREKQAREQAEGEARRVLENEESSAERATEHKTQLAQLRKELAKEKQAKEQAEGEARKVLENKESSTERDTEHKTQLAQLRKELAKEKQARERAEREAEKAVESGESRKAAMGDKVEALKEKLRTTKSQLKETQLALQQVRASQVMVPSRDDALKDSAKPVRAARKRKAVTVDVPETIATPGKEAPRGRASAIKRLSRVSTTMPGDKSSFSITPFLNRTASLAPASPLVEPSQEHAGQHSNANDEAASNAEVEPSKAAAAEPAAGLDRAAGVAKKKRGKKLAPAAAADAPASASAPAHTADVSKRPKASKIEICAGPSTLAKVIEENEENEAPVEATNLSNEIHPASAEDPMQSTTMVTSILTDEPNRTKRRRKLLGTGPAKILLDGEGVGDEARPLGKAASLFASAKGFPLARKGLLAAKGAGSAPAMLFSPLKKDRKAASAQSSLIV